MNDPIVDETNRSKFENGKAIIVATADPNVRPLKKAEEEKQAIPVSDVNENKADEQTLAVNYVAPEPEALPFAAFLPEDANDLNSVISAHKNIPKIALNAEESRKILGMFAKDYESTIPDFFSKLETQNGFALIMETFDGFTLPHMFAGYSEKELAVKKTALALLKDILGGIEAYPDIEIMERQLRNTYPYNRMENVLPTLGERVKVISCEEIKKIIGTIEIAGNELNDAREENSGNDLIAEELIEKIADLVNSAIDILKRTLLSEKSVNDLKDRLYPCLIRVISLMKAGEEARAFDVAKDITDLKKKAFAEFTAKEKLKDEVKPENKSVRRKVVKKNAGNGIEESASEQITLPTALQEEVSPNTNGSEIINEAENNLTEPVVKEEAVTA
ncbi:hypothetical protein IPF86_02125 [Candidatus Nomurabacteria bacterium]|nr:MAG: hypothetical protein IPF86_02125 [Candidatus Nomurabacteria bacterium]